NKDRVVDESELAEEARRLLAEAEAADAREDALAAEEQAARRGLLPAGFTSEEERRARLDAAAKRLAKARQPAAEAPAAEEGQQQPETAKVRGRALASARRGKRNRTDPDSRILRTRAGFIQGYNAQVAVGESHVVLACAVSRTASERPGGQDGAPARAGAEQAPLPTPASARRTGDRPPQAPPPPRPAAPPRSRRCRARVDTR